LFTGDEMKVTNPAAWLVVFTLLAFRLVTNAAQAA